MIISERFDGKKVKKEMGNGNWNGSKKERQKIPKKREDLE